MTCGIPEDMVDHLFAHFRRRFTIRTRTKSCLFRRVGAGASS